MLQMLVGYRLEACRYRGRLVIQKRQDKPRKTIFFKSVAASAGHGDGQKAANSRTGFKKGTHLQAVILECSVYLPGYCVHEEFRCVKSSQDGGFYTVDDGLPHGVVIIGICAYQVLQLADRLGHIIADGMLRSYIQYIFNPPKPEYRDNTSFSSSVACRSSIRTFIAVAMASTFATSDFNLL